MPGAPAHSDVHSEHPIDPEASQHHAARPRRRRPRGPCRPRPSCRPRPGDVPPALLAEPGADDPAGGDQRDGHGLVRLLPRLLGDGPAGARARVARVLVGRLALPRRGRGRAAGAPAGDDAAHLDGHRRRLRGLDGHEPRLARPRLLVGAGRAGHDHAAGPLAGDEGDRPGPGCAAGAGRAAARRGRAGRPRRPGRRRVALADLPSRRRRAGPPRAPGSPPTARSSRATPSSTSP